VIESAVLSIHVLLLLLECLMVHELFGCRGRSLAWIRRIDGCRRRIAIVAHGWWRDVIARVVINGLTDICFHLSWFYKVFF